LEELAHKTNELAACTQDAFAYASAINHISTILTKTLPPPPPPPPTLTPTLIRATSSSSKGPSLPKKNANPILHRQHQAPKDAALELLTYHGIRIPTDTHPTDTQTVTSILHSAIKDRHSRLQDLQTSTQQSISTQVAESVDFADGALQDLMGALYAYSPYTTVNLTHSNVTERLASLDHDIESLGEGIKRLHLGRLAEVEERRLTSALG
jgi:hypothetical protein